MRGEVPEERHARPDQWQADEGERHHTAAKRRHRFRTVEHTDRRDQSTGDASLIAASHLDC